MNKLNATLLQTLASAALSLSSIQWRRGLGRGACFLRRFTAISGISPLTLASVSSVVPNLDFPFL